MSGNDFSFQKKSVLYETNTQQLLQDDSYTQQNFGHMYNTLHV